jgi:phospholipid transport system substrate-binding protein
MNYGRETIDNDMAEVYTEVVGLERRGDADYSMRLAAGDWKVYDVVIDDISIVADFCSQFARILKNDSLNGLMAKMRAKSAPV